MEAKKSILPWIVVAIVVGVFAIVAAIIITRPPRNVAVPAPAPEVVPAPPVPEKEKAAPVVKQRPKVVKKAPEKDSTPEAPKLKPIEPKVIHQ